MKSLIIAALLPITCPADQPPVCHFGPQSCYCEDSSDGRSSTPGIDTSDPTGPGNPGNDKPVGNAGEKGMDSPDGSRGNSGKPGKR